MACFIVRTKTGSYFIDKQTSGFMAMRALHFTRPDLEICGVDEIRRFISIYGDYIDLDGGKIEDCRPIRIAEKKNGLIISYVKERGLSDPVNLAPFEVLEQFR